MVVSRTLSGGLTMVGAVRIELTMSLGRLGYSQVEHRCSMTPMELGGGLTPPTAGFISPVALILAYPSVVLVREVTPGTSFGPRPCPFGQDEDDGPPPHPLGWMEEVGAQSRSYPRLSMVPCRALSGGQRKGRRRCEED